MNISIDWRTYPGYQQKLKALAEYDGFALEDEIQWAIMRGIDTRKSHLLDVRLNKVALVSCPLCKAGGGPTGKRNFCRKWRNYPDPWPGGVHPERVAKAITANHWTQREEDLIQILFPRP